MSVRLRPARGGNGFEYSIVFTWPEGGWFRERRNAPVKSKDAARRWAEARERSLLVAGKAAHESSNADIAKVSTLADFWPRVVSDHYRANRKKASTISAAESIFKNHLAEPLGPKPLHLITSADVAALKGELAKAAPKTVNNVLSVLSRALRCAVEWEVIPALPCRFGLLKIGDDEQDWYELADYQRLVDAAKKCGPEVHLLVLLAGSAGMRRGEIIALKWTDVDLARRQIRLERAVWQTIEDTTKGGRSRVVPLTPDLAAALKAHRHLRERVLYSDKGRELSNRTVRNWLARAQRRAGLKANGGIHMLRHTFCSHLAIAGVPAKAIQELAGHADLKTTQRYMHLSPGNRSDAIATLARYHSADANPSADGARAS